MPGMTTARWILTAMGITGAILNAMQIWWCWPLWIAANIGWIVVNARLRRPQESTLFAVYLATAALGCWQWSRP
ncbi:MAG: hypothetical protein OEV73_00340 [Desulfobulbaceae bacterium]|nr:hypothetical protein [Desulfobulbaceae bacterium]